MLKLNLNQKVLKFIRTSIVFALLALSAEMAQAAGPGGLTCYIYIAGPCHNNLSVRPNSWFVDSDPGGHIDGARCVERATEWYNYCGNPLNIMTAYSALNATIPLKGGEVNAIFGFRAYYGAGIYGPLGRVLYLK